MRDITGERFDRWTALEPSIYKNGQQYWKCRCDCGNVGDVSVYSLINGRSHSCGCKAQENRIACATTHGQSKTRLYRIWKGMRRRCYNPNDNVYRFYGGRGITVCDEWGTFPPFHDWAYQNGYDDTATGHACTLDRIDCNGPYSPENCRWADVEMQHTNTRRTRRITIDGETHIMRDWSAISGVPKPTIHRRLQCGWAEKDAVFLKPSSGNRYTQILKEREETNHG